MKKIFDDKWHGFICILVFVLTAITVIITILPKDGSFMKNVGSTLLLCGFSVWIIGLMICGTLNEWMNDYPDNKRIALKTAFTCMLVLLVVTALLLGGFVFVSEETVTDREIVGGENTIVYTTDTGDCYHKSYCGYLKSKHQTTQHDAELDGYLPCSACFDGIGLKRVETSSTKQIHNYGTAFLVSSISFVAIYVLIAIAIIKKKE